MNYEEKIKKENSEKYIMIDKATETIIDKGNTSHEVAKNADLSQYEDVVYLHNFEHRNPGNTVTQPLSEKLEERVKNWADSYDSKRDYTQGKILGAMHAVATLKKIEKEEGIRK